MALHFFGFRSYVFLKRVRVKIARGEKGENIEGGKGIPRPKKQSLPEWINAPSNSHGTIVIWDKVDNSRSKG